jgi:2-polyprenyl-3-methyl-5-hydroxy-6-metoxy-1,4-benzoquinol methylase
VVLQSEDFEIKMGMGMASVTMANTKEGVDALDMMEEYMAGAREENQMSFVNMDEGHTYEQQSYI